MNRVSRDLNAPARGIRIESELMKAAGERSTPPKRRISG